jgi:hypothetical protein
MSIGILQHVDTRHNIPKDIRLRLCDFGRHFYGMFQIFVVDVCEQTLLADMVLSRFGNFFSFP